LWRTSAGSHAPVNDREDACHHSWRFSESRTTNLRADDVEQTFEDAVDVFFFEVGQFMSQAFRGECPNLADFNPGWFWELSFREGKRQRKSSPLRLAGDGQGNHGARVGVEDLMTEDEHWAVSGLLFAPAGLQIRPVEVAP